MDNIDDIPESSEYNALYIEEFDAALQVCQTIWHIKVSSPYS